MREEGNHFLHFHCIFFNINFIFLSIMEGIKPEKN